MTASERQLELIREFGAIEDPRERFQVIVETAAAKAPPFPKSLQNDSNLVPGCISRVWLSVRAGPGGGIEVHVDSESPALRAIGALYGVIYSGATAAEIVSTEPDFIQRLGIDRHLTPTRLRGLARIREGLVAKVSPFLRVNP